MQRHKPCINVVTSKLVSLEYDLIDSTCVRWMVKQAAANVAACYTSPESILYTVPQADIC